MKEVQLKDAKATLSHVLVQAIAAQPIITRHGKREGVLISYSEYQRLSRVPSFGWLLANSPLLDEDLPARKPARRLRGSES